MEKVILIIFLHHWLKPGKILKRNDQTVTGIRENLDVYSGTVYLNEMVDEGLPLHPLEEQRQSVQRWRQIGLGHMGLGSMLIKLGIKYGSEESLSLCDQIGSRMINTALQQLAILAKEEGPYLAYKREAVLKSDFLRVNSTEETYNLVKKRKRRYLQKIGFTFCGLKKISWFNQETIYGSIFFWIIKRKLFFISHMNDFNVVQIVAEQAVV